MSIDLDPQTDSLSYWHATAEPYLPSGNLPRTAEVVIVGGGLLGCWTAYWLAKANVNVVLLEKTAIGWGATGRNGGFLAGGTSLPYPALIETVGRDRARNLHQLTLDGRELAFEVVAAEAIACDLRRAGTLSLALSPESRANMQASREALLSDGFEGDVLDRQQVQELVGTPLGEQIVGGQFSASDGLLHSSRYLAGIARAAERHGATLARATASSLVAEGTGTRVETDAGNVSAERVVVALNAWSDTLVPELAGLVVPTRGQILAHEPSAPIFRSAVGADLSPTGEYWQQAMDGSIVIGGRRADAPNRDLGVREMAPTPEVTAKIEAVLPTLFPELASLRVARRWAGPMAFTSDYLPVVDAAPGGENVWFAGGFNGHGMTFGPKVGQLLAQAVVSGTKPEDLAPLGIDRLTLKSLA